MSYRKALEAAGAKIVAYDEFGSYQGDWWAKVIHNGVTKWVNGYFGSCSGCDSFAAEFDYVRDDDPEYKNKLAAFGRGYLEAWSTQEEAEKYASRNIEWDSDAQEMLQFIKDNK